MRVRLARGERNDSESGLLDAAAPAGKDNSLSIVEHHRPVVVALGDGVNPGEGLDVAACRRHARQSRLPGTPAKHDDVARAPTRAKEAIRHVENLGWCASGSGYLHDRRGGVKAKPAAAGCVEGIDGTVRTGNGCPLPIDKCVAIEPRANDAIASHVRDASSIRGGSEQWPEASSEKREILRGLDLETRRDRRGRRGMQS